MSEQSRALRAAREAAGVSLSRMAELTHYSKALVGHLETGRRAVTSAHVAAYEQALGLRINTTFDRVDTADVDLLTQATDTLTALGLRYGGIASAEIARAHWEWASGLMSRPMVERVRTAFSGQAARLADRYAWSLADSGRPRQAVSTYRTALELAPGESAVRPVILVDLANHYTSVGAPGDALATLEHVSRASAVVEFTAHAARARAYAELGEREPTLRHVALADDSHARVDLADLPETHRPFVSGHEAHAHNEAGKALFVLSRHGHRKAGLRAAERLQAAIDRFGPERARAVARCEARLQRL